MLQEKEAALAWHKVSKEESITARGTILWSAESILHCKVDISDECLSILSVNVTFFTLLSY